MLGVSMWANWEHNPCIPAESSPSGCSIQKPWAVTTFSGHFLSHPSCVLQISRFEGSGEKKKSEVYQPSSTCCHLWMLFVQPHFKYWSRCMLQNPWDHPQSQRSLPTQALLWLHDSIFKILPLVSNLNLFCHSLNMLRLILVTLYVQNRLPSDLQQPFTEQNSITTFFFNCLFFRLCNSNLFSHWLHILDL